MTLSVVVGGRVPGGSGVTLLARLRGQGGQLLTQASLSAIAYAVSDLADGTTLGTGSFTIGQAVYDDLQRGDPRWRADSAEAPGPDGAHGYNFRVVLPASLFPTRTIAEPGLLAGERQPHRYQCDVRFTPASGEAFRVVFRWTEGVVYG